MPNFRLVTSKEVLANVIRGVGYKLPAQYHDDILEWIPEGIGLIQVTRSLIKSETGDIDCPGEKLVTNYCTSLPCGFITMVRMEDEHRVPILKSSDTERLRTINNLESRPSVFEVDPFSHPTSDGTTGTPSETPNIFVNIQGGDLLQGDIASNFKYYEIKGNRIQTSFESGFVKMFYLSLPVCEEGYPLIPDNANVKMALEFHILRRLIASGYEHKVFTWKEANEQFEIYAARAMNEVSYPSLDDMDATFRTNIRIVPPIGYADQFFVNNLSYLR